MDRTPDSNQADLERIVESLEANPFLRGYPRWRERSAANPNATKSSYFLKCFPMPFLKRHKYLSLNATMTRKLAIIKRESGFLAEYQRFCILKKQTGHGE